jgi:putative membrane protein
MIVRDRPSGLRLFLVMRGSILASIWQSLAVTTLLAVLVTWTGGQFGPYKITLTTTPFTLMGLPLAIFLGFRNNSAYDRYWEGRKQWGELVLRARNLARQCLTLVDPARPYACEAGDIRARMVYRTIAFCYALKHQLRNSAGGSEVARWLAGAEWARVLGRTNLPHALMLEMGADLARCLRQVGSAPPPPANASRPPRSRSRTRCCCTAPPTCTASCCHSDWSTPSAS